MNIMFLGPDGAGKSTIIRNLIERLNSDGARKIYVFHLKTGVPHHLVANPIPPSGVRQYGYTLSILKLIYLLIESHVRYLAFFIKKGRGRNEVVIYDRHVIEILFDAKRFGYHGPAFLLPIFYRLANRPNIVYIILAQPAQLVARKNELNYEEAVEAIRRYSSMANILNIEVIWNDGNLADAVSRVLKKLNA